MTGRDGSALWAYRNLVKVEAVPPSGASLGRGWNSFLRQQTSSSCVEFEPGQEHRWIDTIKFREVFDREEVFRALNLSVSAKYGGSVFSASGRVDFAKSSTFNSSNLNVLATARVQDELVYAKPVSQASAIVLKADYKKMLEADRIDDFQRACGDHFIVAIASGGEFHVLASVNTQSEKERAELSVGFKAKYFAASGSADFKSVFDKKRDAHQTEVNFYQEAGPEVSLPLAGTSDEVQEALKSFVKREHFVGRQYEISLFPYWQIDPAAQRIPSNLSLADSLANHALRLADLSRVYIKALEQPNDYVLNFMESEAKIVEAQSSLHYVARQFDSLVGECVEHQSCENLAEAVLRVQLSNKSVQRNPTGMQAAPYTDAERSQLIRNTIGFPRFLNDAARIASQSDQEKIGNIVKLNVNGSSLGPGAQQLKELERAPSVTHEFKNMVATLNSTTPFTDAIAVQMADSIADNGFIFYLQRLANVPLSRTEFTEVFFDAAAQTFVGKSTTNESQRRQAATKILSNWILRSRLLPTVRRYCEIDEGHPLCVDTNLLVNIASAITIDQDFKTNNFDAPTPPAPTTAPAPPPAPKPQKTPTGEPRDWGHGNRT